WTRREARTSPRFPYLVLPEGSEEEHSLPMLPFAVREMGCGRVFVSCASEEMARNALYLFLRPLRRPLHRRRLLRPPRGPQQLGVPFEHRQPVRMDRRIGGFEDGQGAAVERLGF